jgi:hypothetical protein
MLLINQGYCYIQSLHFSYVLQEDSVQKSRQWSSSPLHLSGRCGIPYWRSSIMQHPSGWCDLSPQTPICVQKLRTVSGYIHSDVLATRPDALKCSRSKRISFPNTNMRRQLQPSRRRGYSVWTLSLIRQDVQKIYNHSDVSLHYPDAQFLLWKLRATKVQR